MPFGTSPGSGTSVRDLRGEGCLDLVGLGDQEHRRDPRRAPPAPVVHAAGRRHRVRDLAAVGHLHPASPHGCVVRCSAVAGILYTIPALAAFALLVGWLGLFSLWTAMIPLITYTLYILIRAVIVGLDGVDPAVLDAADGHGLPAHEAPPAGRAPPRHALDPGGPAPRHRHHGGSRDRHRRARAGRLRPADLRRAVQLLPHAGHRRHDADGRPRRRPRRADRRSPGRLLAPWAKARSRY